MRLCATLLAACLSMSLLGCGTVLPPNEKLTEAEAAIRGAREIGAPEVPRASLHLRLAEEQLDKARNLMAREQHARAELALIRAQSDAELAIAVSREHQVKVEKDSAMDKVRKLKAALGK